MSSDSHDGGSITSTTSAPDYLKPYLNQALQGAQQQYQAGAPAYYPGSTVAPLSGTTQAALAAQAARGQAGSPLVDQASQFVSQGLQKPITSTFGGATNPYLDATYDQAAQKSRSTLESEFARGGRTLSAAAPARADMLSSLATQIYAPAYENERNRQLQDLTAQRSQQQNLLSYASPLAAADYMDIAAQRDAGSALDAQAQKVTDADVARYNYNATSGDLSLDSYLKRLQSMPGSSSTQGLPPTYTNPLATGLGLALGANSLTNGAVGNVLGTGVSKAGDYLSSLFGGSKASAYDPNAPLTPDQATALNQDPAQVNSGLTGGQSTALNLPAAAAGAGLGAGLAGSAGGAGVLGSVTAGPITDLGAAAAGAAAAPVTAATAAGAAGAGAAGAAGGAAAASPGLLADIPAFNPAIPSGISGLGSGALGGAAAAATVAGMGVLGPFLISQGINKELDMLPTPVQINDPRYAGTPQQYRWTQSKSDYQTTLNDIRVWDAQHGNITTVSDQPGFQDTTDYNSLLGSVMGPNYAWGYGS